MGKLIKITEYLSEKVRNTPIKDNPQRKMEYYEKMTKRMMWYKERNTQND
jgi:hypothetical protein